jgi:hypothetical protein
LVPQEIRLGWVLVVCIGEEGSVFAIGVTVRFPDGSDIWIKLVRGFVSRWNGYRVVKRSLNGPSIGCCFVPE